MTNNDLFENLCRTANFQVEDGVTVLHRVTKVNANAAMAILTKPKVVDWDDPADVGVYYLVSQQDVERIAIVRFDGNDFKVLHEDASHNYLLSKDMKRLLKGLVPFSD